MKTHVLKFSDFLNEGEDVQFVTLNTDRESLKIAAVYNEKSGKGAVRIIGKHGPRDYKINVTIPLIYTGPVQPTKIDKELVDGGTSAKYTIHTNVKGQTHEIPKKDALELAKMYNTDTRSKNIGRANFSRTWELKDIA
jgi:hypothetical protein